MIPRPGDVLGGGRYRVEGELGRGGMGVVLRARDLSRDSTVAIKWVLEEDTVSIARMLREARAVASLEHENVVRVLDVVPEGASFFLVLEHLEGETLAARLARGPLEPGEAAALLLPVAAAMGTAHAAGIVHRDLKPENVFLARAPGGGVVPKVLDFGVAKVPREVGTPGTLTQTGEVLGSPYYASPEQIQGQRDIDPRTDVYSLGVVLYHALTGAVPFRADTYPKLVFQIVMAGARPLRELRPDLPVELERVVATAMARERNARFPDMASFARALGVFSTPQSASGSGSPAARRSAAPAASAPPALPVLAPPSVPHGAPPARSATVASLPPYPPYPSQPSSPAAPTPPTAAAGWTAPPAPAPPHDGARPASLVTARALPRRRGAWIAALAVLCAGCVGTLALCGVLGGKLTGEVANRAHGPVRSSACLVDANGDSVLDAAALAGFVTERDLVLLDGVSGDVLFGEGGYSISDAVFCPSRSWVGVRKSGIEVHLLSASSPERVLRRTLPAELRAYGMAPGCMALRDGAGGLSALTLPDGASGACLPERMLDVAALGERRGIGSVGMLGETHLEQTVEGTRYRVEVANRHAPLVVSASRDGSTVWHRTLDVGPAGDFSSLAFAWTPQALVVIGGDRPDGASTRVVGLSAATGAELYRAPLCRRTRYLGSCEYNGRWVLVSDTASGLCAIDPATGRVAWRRGGC